MDRFLNHLFFSFFFDLIKLLKMLLNLLNTMTVNMFDIEFTPLDVPLSRRKETFGALVYVTMIWVCFFTFVYMCFNPRFQVLALIYVVYIYFDKTSELGARRNDWVRDWTVWKWFADFFPAKLVIETPLDPTKNYIFGYHPHGILVVGAVLNFGTNGTEISKKLPGLNIRVLTLAANLIVPFYREILFAFNLASVSKSSILNILDQGPGHSCLIVVGGSQEALSAKPESCDLVLKNRLGFIKMALQTGASLVPVFGFGENNLFRQVDVAPGSSLNKLQLFVKRWTGFSAPFFFGRGVFNYTIGPLPRRHPLVVVVGSPIQVDKDLDPSPEKIQLIHKKYLTALHDLYLRNQSKYIINNKAPPMRFI